MKTTRLVFAVIFVFSFVFGVLLFVTSQKVQGVSRDIRTVEKAVDNEKESIRVLNAEWHYLNPPDRLERLVSDMEGGFGNVNVVDVDDVAEQDNIIHINGVVPVPESKPKLVNNVADKKDKGFGELLSDLSPSSGGEDGN